MNVENSVAELHKLNENRDAFSSINGYFYQFELTLLHILYEGKQNDPFNDKNCSAFYKVETIEDYVKFYEKDTKGFIRVAQIKHHTTKTYNSTYSDAVLYLYYNYLNFLNNKVKDTEYLATIFHYDQSAKKDILTVLNDAFKSKEKKADKDKKKEDNGEIVKKNLNDVHKKIIATGLENDVNRKRFSEIGKLVKTESHLVITEKLKKELYARYGKSQTNNSPEHLYASAVSKLIDDSKKGYKVTLSELDKYFRNEVEAREDFYALKIIDYVMGIIDTNLIEISGAIRVTDEDINDYTFLYSEFIIPFMKSKLKISEYRKSFLLTITPKELKKLEELNTLFEFQSFLEANDAIKQFLSTLAKILFYHMKNNAMTSLEEWFVIDSKGWLFHYPYEERGNGIIIGDFTRDLYTSLSYMLPRLRDKDLRPDVWYVRHNDDQFSASDNMNYEHDFMMPRDEREMHIFCQPNSAHFHIQCLHCLSLNSYSNSKKVHNIFLDRCSERGED